MDDPNIVRPSPRRPGDKFNLKPISTSTPPPPLASDGQRPPSPSWLHPSSSSSLAAPSTVSTTDHNSASTEPHRTRSVMNLTASALVGIYGPTTGYDTPNGGGARSAGDSESVVNTPWGTGAQTPLRNGSITSQDRNGNNVPMAAARLREQAELSAIPKRRQGSTSISTSRNIHASNDTKINDQHRRRRSSMHLTKGSPPTYGPYSTSRTLLRTTLRSTLLAVIGIAYGAILTQLHATRGLAPVKVKNIDRASWTYLCFWAVSGVLLGNLLPWLDRALGARIHRSWVRRVLGAGVGEAGSGVPIVRSVGAFVGIAFAIRRLPWQSTLQLSLTLTLANPVIWYLLDRTASGFLLSALFATFGASALLTINPSILPSPLAPRLASLTSSSVGSAGRIALANASVAVSGEQSSRFGLGLGGLGLGLGEKEYESIAVATWIASVLFVSCVCFGNIGRRLALEEVKDSESGGNVGGGNAQSAEDVVTS